MLLQYKSINFQQCTKITTKNPYLQMAYFLFINVIFKIIFIICSVFKNANKLTPLTNIPISSTSSFKNKNFKCSFKSCNKTYSHKNKMFAHLRTHVNHLIILL